MSNEKFIFLANDEIEAEYIFDDTPNDIVHETPSLNGWSMVENIGIAAWNPAALARVMIRS
jgi:hypothetical protein